MTSEISRRDACKAMASAGVVGLTVPVYARGQPKVTKQWTTRNRGGLTPMRMEIFDITDAHRQNVLGSALHELHTLFREKDVYNNAYTLPVDPAELVDDDYWKKCELVNHPQKGFNTRKMLLWNQMFFMRDADPFPTINIKPFTEKTTVWAYAYIGKVLTKWTGLGGKNVDITGEFEVFVNLEHLGRGGVTDHANMWSSVIAHEMLHNLGHLHKPNEYVDGRQINAFHRALYCQGKYDGKKHVPGFG